MSSTMTIANRAHIYHVVALNSYRLPFGARNLLLAETAKALGLVHVFDAEGFYLYRRKPYTGERTGKALVAIELEGLAKFDGMRGARP